MIMIGGKIQLFSGDDLAIRLWQISLSPLSPLRFACRLTLAVCGASWTLVSTVSAGRRLCCPWQQLKKRRDHGARRWELCGLKSRKLAC